MKPLMNKPHEPTMKQRAWSVPRELLIVIAVIALSALLLPGVIYTVGARLFGAYSRADGVGQIYLATLGDLAVPTLPAWTLLLAPALCVLLVRVVFHMTQATPKHGNQPEPLIHREPTIGS